VPYTVVFKLPANAVLPGLDCLQAARLRREAAKLRELQQQLDALAAEGAELRQQLATAVHRAERAESEVTTLKVGGWGLFVGDMFCCCSSHVPPLAVLQCCCNTL
jgi:hypothetical protein